MSLLETFVGKFVEIVTNDGRCLVGILRGFDQTTNVILEKCEERVFSRKEAVQQVSLGLYIVRGDNIAIVGEINDDKDKKIDFSRVKADPLKQLVH